MAFEPLLNQPIDELIFILIGFAKVTVLNMLNCQLLIFIDLFCFLEKLIIVLYDETKPRKFEPRCAYIVIVVYFQPSSIHCNLAVIHNTYGFYKCDIFKIALLRSVWLIPVSFLWMFHMGFTVSDVENLTSGNSYNENFSYYCTICGKENFQLSRKHAVVIRHGLFSINE